VRFAAGFEPDSAGGYGLWMDVSGPVTERYRFDLTHGRLLYRRWEMDLRGRGTVARPAGGADTVPAGLRSTQEQREVPADFGRLLARELPGTDTTATVEGDQTLLLHTSGRRPGVVEAGMARHDGWVGTATLRYSPNGVPDAYDAVWTDTARAPARFGVAVSAGRVIVHRPSGDTTFAAPAGPWAVADYGFDEMLAPALLALASDTAARPFFIYRPYAARWDTAAVRVRRAPGGIVAVLSNGDGTSPTALVLASDGELLFLRNGSAGGGMRVPREGSAGMQKLKAMQRAVQGAGGPPAY
jgi:hypothetical protein